MPVPDYQSLMLPVLQAVSDGKVHTATQIHEAVAMSQSLTEDDLKELLPSGTQTTFLKPQPVGRHLPEAGGPTVSAEARPLPDHRAWPGRSCLGP